MYSIVFYNLLYRWAQPLVILDGDPNPGLRLAHYLFFVYWICHMIVFCIACIFAKFIFWQHNKMISESDGTIVQTLARIATFLVPSLSWFITKYQYYFCLNLVFLNFTTLATSIAYFYSLLNSGCSLFRLVKKTFLILIIFFQKHWISDWSVNGSSPFRYLMEFPSFSKYFLMLHTQLYKIHSCFLLCLVFS